MLLEKLAVVTSVYSSEQVRPVSFSFAEDKLGIFQRVDATLVAFEYPGEVVVANEWQQQFGEQLDGATMFRFVLLQSAKSPADSEIADPRILVAIQTERQANSNRIGETRAAYIVDSPRVESRRDNEADIKSIREVREN